MSACITHPSQVEDELSHRHGCFFGRDVRDLPRAQLLPIALLAVFVILFFSALRRWGELENPDAVLAQCVLAGTVVATIVVSAFDVVLVLAAPSFLVWSILGATSGIRRNAAGEDKGSSGISFVILYQIRLCRACATDALGRLRPSVGLSGEMKPKHE